MKTLILNDRQINQKLDRIAYEIYENNFDEEALFLVGIKGNGFIIAEELKNRLKEIGKQNITICKLMIHKSNPLAEVIELSIPLNTIDNHAVILIDDVINSGKTMQYALMKLLERPTRKIKTATLVDRKHRNYPIRCDYEGLSLSTTLQNQIEVVLKGEKKVFLY